MDIWSSKVATYVPKMGPHAVAVRLKRNPVGLARFLLDSEKENLPKLLATSKIGVYFLPIAECFITRSKCLSNKTHQGCTSKCLFTYCSFSISARKMLVESLASFHRHFISGSRTPFSTSSS